MMTYVDISVYSNSSYGEKRTEATGEADAGYYCT